jgi:hypothetical protein
MTIGLQGNVKDQAGFRKEIGMSSNNAKGHFQSVTDSDTKKRNLTDSSLHS